jgi:hypothetical protein
MIRMPIPARMDITLIFLNPAGFAGGSWGCWEGGGGGAMHGGGGGSGEATGGGGG